MTKIKLERVVNSIGRGLSHEEFAARLRENGCRASASAVQKWLSLDRNQLPNARVLRAIKFIRPEISIDWLLNVKDDSQRTKQEITLDDWIRADKP